MRRKYLFLYVAVVVVLAGWHVSKRFHFVHHDVAVRVAASYYERLKYGDATRAFEMYSAEFRDQQGKQWLDFLIGMQRMSAPVSNVRFIGATFVPDRGSNGFSLLSYEISRGALTSEEQLLITRSPKPEIAGHKLVRSDTKHEVVAGRMVTSVGVKIP